ncbi:conserved hypothetical protein [Agrobacterium fabrum str. J-07]|nr:conserved hypothetical protein [Agrobacterium fabrum str. J-07]
MIDEDPEKPVFSAAQGHCRALPVEQVAAHRVETPLTKCQELPRLADLQIGRQHSGAAQDGLDACEKLPGREGFRQIVVGAHFEPDDPIHLVIACGQHQHRRGLVLAGPQLSAENQPVIAGHHHVEHDQIDGVAIEKTSHLSAVGRNGGAQAVLLQVAGDQFPDFPVVVNDKNVIDMFHWVPSSSGRFKWPATASSAVTGSKTTVRGLRQA